MIKTFFYKMIIVAILLIVVFEFTVGKRMDPINQNIDKIFKTEGRKELIEKLRAEMREGLDKEYILNEDDRVLIYNFFNKIQSEINSVEKNQ